MGCVQDGQTQLLTISQEHIPRTVKSAYGDGAYDKEVCYKILKRRGITPIVPPQKNAVFTITDKKPWLRPRQEALFMIRGLGDDDEARKIWKKLIGYH